MTETTTDLAGATNILLEEPSIGHVRDVCTSLLVDGYEAPNVLFVTYNQQARECVEQVATEALGGLAVITVGDASTAVDDSSVATENVSTASDLTGLGIEMGQFLSTWDAPVVVCFDSLTSMLQYVDFQTAYEFIHAITGQIHAANARAHFHIDPDAHGTRDVAGIKSLFDAAVTLEQDGYAIRKRKLLE